MKKLKKYDAAEMSIEEQRALDGGVVEDENGRSCTEHGIPDVLRKLMGRDKPTNEF